MVQFALAARLAQHADYLWDLHFFRVHRSQEPVPRFEPRLLQVNRFNSTDDEHVVVRLWPTFSDSTTRKRKHDGRPRWSDIAAEAVPNTTAPTDGEHIGHTPLDGDGSEDEPSWLRELEHLSDAVKKMVRERRRRRGLSPSATDDEAELPAAVSKKDAGSAGGGQES